MIDAFKLVKEHYYILFLPIIIHILCFHSKKKGVLNINRSKIIAFFFRLLQIFTKYLDKIYMAFITRHIY